MAEVHNKLKTDSLISFIIPAWNEEAVLGRALETLSAAAAKVPQPFEIIVVDDASTDATADVARRRGARVIGVNHRQISATRNAGARAALGELFIFIDADTIVSGQLLLAAVEAIRSGAVGGGCLVLFDSPIPTYARLLQPVGIFIQRVFRLAYGCFIFCSRDAFEAVGGFDARVYAGEEIIMSQALKRQGRFVILPCPVVTSGRKVRVYSAIEVFAILTRVALGGRRFLRSRAGKEIWYSKRRDDTERDFP